MSSWVLKLSPTSPTHGLITGHLSISRPLTRQKSGNHPLSALSCFPTLNEDEGNCKEGSMSST